MRLYRIKQNRISSMLIVSLCMLLVTYKATAGQMNGFDLTNAIIPQAEILSGGPAKDGIPALSNPGFLSPREATYLKPEDRIIGITLDGISRAYPIAILNWHEIVNDQINGHHYAITYCPLCGTGVAFSSTLGEQIMNFGVSGLLYNSDVLLYDRASHSLWSQIMASAISGKFVGKKLQRIPISHTTWRAWLQKHPQTKVLSNETGYSRDYDQNPYHEYEKSRLLYFAVNHRAPDTYHPKEQVVGIEIKGVFKAYPYIELEKQAKSNFKDTVNGVTLTFYWDQDNRSMSITDSSGREIVSIQGFWFAWFAFHPQTQVFSASESENISAQRKK